MKRSTNSKSGAAKRIRTSLTPYQAERLARISNEHAAQLVVPEYPHPLVYAAHVASQQGLHDHARELLANVHPDIIKSLEGSHYDDLLSAMQQGPLFAKGKGGGNHHPSTSPQQGQAAALAAVGQYPLAGMEGNLICNEFNAEMGNGSKAVFHAPAYAVIVPRCHFMLCSEVDYDWMKTVGQANGYGWFVAKGNGRGSTWGQASGILLHPRLRVLNKIEYPQITNVQGVPQLRPALRLDVEDSTSGYKFALVAVHLKSMRGGPAATAPVRYQQCQILAQLMGADPAIMGGDFNCFLNNTKDTDALYQSGWKLLYPGDTTSTQRMGGRLDGYFLHNLPFKVGKYSVNPLHNTISDHDITRAEIFVCKGQDCSGSGDPKAQ